MEIKENKIETGIIYSYAPENTDYSGSELKLFLNEDPKYYETIKFKEVLKTIIEYYSENEVAVYIGNDIVFVDCGENFNNVYCPKCSAEITEDWQNFMDKASENDFKNLEIITKCCNFKTDLNSLKYVEKCGFSKVIFTINNYNENSADKLIDNIWKKHNIKLIPIFSKY